jgi:general secretion pathway protein F
VLLRLAEFLERTREMTQSVRSALIYPAVLVAMAIASLIVVLTVVLPTFEPLFADAGKKLPLATQIVRALGVAFREWWWLAIVLVGVGVLWYRRDISTVSGRQRWHGLVLRVPIVGSLVREVAFARFARMLGTLLANGVGVLTAMGHARRIVGNEVLAEALDSVSASLKEGGGLARPLAATKSFPRLAVDLISVGEETGRLEDMLLRAADLYEKEVARTLQRALSLLVPLLTLGLGALIAALIGSVLVAILSINELAL